MTGLSVVFTELLASGIAPLAVRTLPGGSVVVGGTALGAAAGLMGSSILDRFLGDDEDDEDDGGDSGGDDPFGGGDGGGGDDPFGDDFDMGDGGGGDNPFGGGEFDDDPFAEEGGDGDTAELQERVDELEGEVASLSSTVNTVRSENKEISETVDEIAEDVRGLLDIYEMVTRGINPFVDDDSLGGGGFEGGSSLGLFDDDGGDDEDDDLDDDIAGADAESFFDDDILDDGDDDSFDDTEDDFDMMDDTSSGDSSGDGGGGKSFDELKAEYESGDAEWAGDDGESAPADGLDEAEEMSDDGSFDDDFGEMDDDLGGMDDDLGGMDELDDGFADDAMANGNTPGNDAMANGNHEQPADPVRNGHSGSPTANADGGEENPPRQSDRDNSGFEFVGDGPNPGGAATKPYLTALPEGYVGDLIVIEWLESLVEESDPTDAARAVGYYERVEWISPDVADRLRDFLTGFGPIDANKVDDPGTEILTLDHHVRSLQYIRQLNGASAESLVIGRWDRISDGPGGIGGGRSGDGDGRRSLLGRDPREVSDGR